VGRGARTRTGVALRERLRAHFGADPTDLPIVTRPLEAWDRPNFQVAIDAFLEQRSAELVGLAAMPGYEIGLAELAGASEWAGNAISVRAPEHVTVPLGEAESITCVQLGLWLVAHGDERLAIMLASCRALAPSPPRSTSPPRWRRRS
jgi:hypothetical protein